MTELLTKDIPEGGFENIFAKARRHYSTSDVKVTACDLSHGVIWKYGLVVNGRIVHTAVFMSNLVSFILRLK